MGVQRISEVLLKLPFPAMADSSASAIGGGAGKDVIWSGIVEAFPWT